MTETTTSGQHDEVIDSIEAAAILGITANNLRQHVWRKEILPCGNRKRRSLFKRADVEALLARRATPKPTTAAPVQ